MTLLLHARRAIVDALAAAGLYWPHAYDVADEIERATERHFGAAEMIARGRQEREQELLEVSGLADGRRRDKKATAARAGAAVRRAELKDILRRRPGRPGSIEERQLATRVLEILRRNDVSVRGTARRETAAVILDAILGRGPDTRYRTEEAVRRLKALDAIERGDLRPDRGGGKPRG